MAFEVEQKFSVADLDSLRDHPRFAGILAAIPEN